MKTPKINVGKLMYFVAIYRDKEKGYWSSLADFPAYDCGDTIEDAIYQSTVFLQGIVDMYTESTGNPLPEASDIETFKGKLDPSDGEPVCIAPIFAYPPSPSVRVQLTAKAHQIAEIDDYAKKHGMTRSELMFNAAREYIRSSN